MEEGRRSEERKGACFFGPLFGIRFLSTYSFSGTAYYSSFSLLLAVSNWLEFGFMFLFKGYQILFTSFRAWERHYREKPVPES